MIGLIFSAARPKLPTVLTPRAETERSYPCTGLSTLRGQPPLLPPPALVLLLLFFLRLPISSLSPSGLRRALLDYIISGRRGYPRSALAPSSPPPPRSFTPRVFWRTRVYVVAHGALAHESRARMSATLEGQPCCVAAGTHVLIATNTSGRLSSRSRPLSSSCFSLFLLLFICPPDRLCASCFE